MDAVYVAVMAFAEDDTVEWFIKRWKLMIVFTLEEVYRVTKIRMHLDLQNRKSYG